MPESNGVMTKRDLSLVIADQGATNSITISKWPGDFTYSAPLHDIVRIRDNGDLDSVRKGDEQPVTCTFTTYVREWTAAGTYGVIPDLCEDRGWWAANATPTNANEGDVDAYSLAVTVDGAPFGLSDVTGSFAKMIFRGDGQLGNEPSTYAVRAESITATKPTFA